MGIFENYFPPMNVEAVSFSEYYGYRDNESYNNYIHNVINVPTKKTLTSLPQVGGITFIFDPAKPPGSRIDPAYIKIGTEYMDKHQHYKLATKSALASGEDGYSGLAQGFHNFFN